MNLVSNKNTKKVFLSLNSTLNVDSKVDIILSPEFYWVRIFDIPVKNEKQAINVLPTLFEDLVDTQEKLSFSLKKLDENKYLCFAYSNKKIYEELKKTKINLSLVNSIYFAQNECLNNKTFIINEKTFLYTPDEILVLAPKSFPIDASSLDLNSISLSSQKVDIKLYNNNLDIKTIYTLVFIFIFIACINLYKLFEYKNEISLLKDKKENLLSSSKMPTSIIRVNSIIKSYESKANKEIEKREALEYILKNKSFKLRKVNLDNDVLDLSFENSDKKRVENYISKKYKIITSKVNALILNIRIKL